MTWKSATDEDILRACGYISDDTYLASIFGVKRSYIVHMRKRLKNEAEEREKRAKRAKRNPPISTDNYERTARTSAAAGSAALLKAIQKFHPERVAIPIAKENRLRYG